MRLGQVLLLVSIAGVLGLLLLLYAANLSRRYNAWTTKLRAKNIGLPAPPTNEMRALNIRIMTVLFRTLAVLLMLPAVLVAFAVIRDLTTRH